MKYLSLVALVVQGTIHGLGVRYARTRPGDLFLSSTAVLMSELMKLISCLGVMFIMEGCSARNLLSSLYKNMVQKPIDTLKVCVPALTYVIQNNLFYIAASHLDAASSQVAYQLKILTTALFTVVILRRRLMPTQWMALVLLLIGVAMVQLAQTDCSPSAATGEQSKLIGFTAAFTACFLSGFAGVCFEKILKDSDASVWLRNVQMSFQSLPFALFTCLLYDWVPIRSHGFFFGYDGFICYLIVMQAVGGLLVAMVFKYADTILKGFATSIAIILLCLVSICLFDFQLTFQFSVGTLLVMAAVFLYGYTPAIHAKM